MTKIYKALLNQVNANNPTAIVLNSSDTNYLGDITWFRDTPGFYYGTIPGTYDLTKISVSIAQTGGGRVVSLQAYQANSTGTGELSPSIETRTWDTSPSPDFYMNDNLLYYTLIEITAEV